MTTKILKCHAGIGDPLICNGLIREIAKNSPETQFFVPTHRHNLALLKQLVSDCDTLIPVSIDTDLYNSVETISITNKSLETRFDRSFYESVNVCFSKR